MGILKIKLQDSIFPGVVLASVLFCGHFSAATEAIDGDSTFTYRTSSEILSLDPHHIQDTTTFAIARDLFEGLFNQGENGELVPGVATKYEANEDNTIFKFHLRDDASWSDGSQVTAHDFVYAWRRATEPKTASPYSWFFESMAVQNASDIISGDRPPSELGVTALDDVTLEVRLEESLAYFPIMTVHATTFPIPGLAIERHGRDWTRPENIISNGAYVLSEFNPDFRAVLTRNENYWDNENTSLESVVLRVIKDSDEALEKYFDRELDMMGTPIGRYPELELSHPEEVHSNVTLCTSYYVFNLSESGPPVFRDSNIRRALSYAVDRRYLAEEVLKSGAVPAYSLTPGATAGFDAPDVRIRGLTQPERDEAALRFLEISGHGFDRSLKFTMLINDSEGSIRLAQELKHGWETKLGTKAEIETVGWREFLDRLNNQEFELARAGWCGDYNEASTFLDLVTSRSEYNSGMYFNETVDRLMTEARKTSAPQAIYAQVEQTIAEEVPIIPLVHSTDVFLLNPDVKNWPHNSVEGIWYSRNLYKNAMN